MQMPEPDRDVLARRALAKAALQNNAARDSYLKVLSPSPELSGEVAPYLRDLMMKIGWVRTCGR